MPINRIRNLHFQRIKNKNRKFYFTSRQSSIRESAILARARELRAVERKADDLRKAAAARMNCVPGAVHLRSSKKRLRGSWRTVRPEVRRWSEREAASSGRAQLYGGRLYNLGGRRGTTMRRRLGRTEEPRRRPRSGATWRTDPVWTCPRLLHHSVRLYPFLLHSRYYRLSYPPVFSRLSVFLFFTYVLVRLLSAHYTSPSCTHSEEMSLLLVLYIARGIDGTGEGWEVHVPCIQGARLRSLRWKLLIIPAFFCDSTAFFPALPFFRCFSC